MYRYTRLRGGGTGRSHVFEGEDRCRFTSYVCVCGQQCAWWYLRLPRCINIRHGLFSTEWEWENNRDAGTGGVHDICVHQTHYSVRRCEFTRSPRDISFLWTFDTPWSGQSSNRGWPL